MDNPQHEPKSPTHRIEDMQNLNKKSHLDTSPSREIKEHVNGSAFKNGLAPPNNMGLTRDKFHSSESLSVIEEGVVDDTALPTVKRMHSSPAFPKSPITNSPLASPNRLPKSAFTRGGEKTPSPPAATSLPSSVKVHRRSKSKESASPSINETVFEKFRNGLPFRLMQFNRLRKAESEINLPSSAASLPKSPSTKSLRPVRTSDPDSLRQNPLFRLSPRELARQASWDTNPYQHCIVCRTCSTQASQIRPGRHFVLSWKQITAMAIVLTTLVGGGGYLFAEIERNEELQRQLNFHNYFQSFMNINTCVSRRDLLNFTTMVLTDSKLALLMLRELNALTPDEDSSDTSPTNGTLSNSTSDSETYSNTNSSNTNNNKNNSSNTSNSNKNKSNNSYSNYGASDQASSNSSKNDSSNNISSIDAGERIIIWNVANSVGFVLSVVTTIGYGHIAPMTSGGRLLCIAYGIIGIPLMLLLLGGLGDKMRRMTSWFIKHKRFFPCSKRFNQVINCTLTAVVGLLFLFVGPSIALTYVEGWTAVDAVYYCFVSLSTIGFGDMVLGDPTSAAHQSQAIGHHIYRLMSLVWVLFGLAYVGMVITSLAHLFIQGSCGAHSVETMRLKAELKRLKYEIRAQRLYTRRSGLSLYSSQILTERDREAARWAAEQVEEEAAAAAAAARE